jgi:hypothetical protein
MNPAAPGLQFHKLDRARDKNFSSLRVFRDIRLIVHRDEAASSLLLAYVGHHDDATSGPSGGGWRRTRGRGRRSSSRCGSG